MHKHLVVVSHTEHYRDENGEIRGWGSTVTELNYLAQHWEKITHVACLHPGATEANALPYTAANIEFKAIPPFGGPGLADKLGILFKMPRIISEIRRALPTATEVQLRLPTGMGVVLLPWFSFRISDYLFWVKYAGNWSQEKAPLGYRFQRWWLKRNFARCKVTINGSWPSQPAHCKSFENPCLFNEELDHSEEIVANKSYDELKVCFVGRLSTNKGVLRILDALNMPQAKAIKEIHFVGDGPLKDHILDFAAKSEIRITFHGFLNRDEIREIYKECQLIMLPSDSEGFPKVIAEAMAYGCIPIVSDVSSIGQYVNNSNGYLWDMKEDFDTYFQTLELDADSLKQRSGNAHKMAYAFTFEAYYRKLQKNVFLKS